jgi:hypothetical protein
MIRDGVHASMAPNTTACRVVIDRSDPCLPLRTKPWRSRFVPRTEQADLILGMSSAGCAAALLRNFFWPLLPLGSPAAAGAQHETGSSRFRRAISRAIHGRSSRPKGRNSEAQRFDTSGRSCQAKPQCPAVTNSPGKLGFTLSISFDC